VTGIDQKVFSRAFTAIETMRIVEELMEIWPNEVVTVCHIQERMDFL